MALPGMVHAFVAKFSAGGPYRVAAGEVYHTGSVQGEVFVPGRAAGQVYHAGTVQGEVQ